MNQKISLKIYFQSSKNKLKTLNCSNNELTNTNFLKNVNSESLEFLFMGNNNFAPQDLSFLSTFVNLEQLYIDNCDKEKFEHDVYNRFYGSLEPLSNLNKLK